ncbi:MAG TPA: NINE protein [Bryobacteraceae bacterium]|jgi:TM2 domain-containing membrane protein YozV|nr:NINE protein [Bryobacteraceae bacterium]
MFCVSCGAQIADTSVFCPNCGGRAGGNAPSASQPTAGDAPEPAQAESPGYAADPAPEYNAAPPQDYQPAPGQAPASPPPVAGASAPKSKLVAGLLGILVGAFGVHRFYLGYTTIAIIQLVLGLLGIVTCGITTIASGIWGLIEGILILTGSINRDAKGVPLAD